MSCSSTMAMRARSSAGPSARSCRPRPGPTRQPEASCPKTSTKQLFSQFAGHDFVDEAPGPGLARLDRANKWMLCASEVLGRVLVDRLVATPDMPALQAQPEVHPGIAGLDALFAVILVGARDLDVLEMRTCFCHGTSCEAVASFALLACRRSLGTGVGHGLHRAAK